MLHDTDSFAIYIKTEDFYEGIADDVKKWFDKSNYDEDDKRLFPIGEKKSSDFKDELEGKIVKELVGIRAKACVMSKHNNFQQNILA